MSDYSKILADIDRYKSVAGLADQQRMLVEEEIQTVVLKIRQADEKIKREKEEMYEKLADPVSIGGKRGHMGYRPQMYEGADESVAYSYASALKTSSAHQLIKDSIRTLPGFTEFVKNSEMMDAFRESYARDVKNYCRQSMGSMPKEFGGSMATSEHLDVSEGKDKLNHLYNTFKNSKEASRKKEGPTRAANHNNTIKEDIREEEEDFATHTAQLDPRGNLGHSADSEVSGLGNLPTRKGPSRAASRKEPSRDKEKSSSLSELRPDLKQSLPEEYQEGLLQIPSDAHLNIKRNLKDSSDYGRSVNDSYKSKENDNQPQNSWMTDREVAKNTLNTNKTKSYREEEYATQFGRQDSESDDKSGFVVGTPHKQPPQRNTVTSDQSYPIKTTSKKDDVLTFRKKDSASKLKHTLEGSSEVMELTNVKESFFDREPGSPLIEGLSPRTNTFQDISHKNMANDSEYGRNHRREQQAYIHEEDYEDTSQNRSPESKYQEYKDASSLDYSHTRRFTTEENFNAQQQKAFRISQQSGDKFKMRASKEKDNLDRVLGRKDTLNFATNLTPLPSANHFDNPGDKTFNIQGVAASEIEKNFGFGGDEMSLVKKPSNRSGTGGTVQALQAALKEGRKPSQEQDRSPPFTIPDTSPTFELTSNYQDTTRRDDKYAVKNKEMIDRFDDFFKKMDINDRDRWEESAGIDDTRMRFFKDSAMGYDEYLEVIAGEKKTSTVMDSADKRVPVMSQQKSHSKINDKVDSSKISYLTDMPSKFNADSQAVGLRVETGGAHVRDTMNSIKHRDTEFDSARVTTERLVYLAQSEMPSDMDAIKGKSRQKDKSESNVTNSVYPRSIQESNMRSRNTYATSKNYNYQVNEEIEDFEDEEFQEDWQPGLSKDIYDQEADNIHMENEADFDNETDNKIHRLKYSQNKNRFSNDQASYFQPSEEIDEVFIDEKLIMPGSMLRSNYEASMPRRTPSGRTHAGEPTMSQLDEEEISLSMGMKNPGQIFKNKLGRDCKNNRYA